jgi:hypothetical protein
MFDLAGLLLDHTPVTLPAFIDGTPSDGPIPFPSGKKLVFGSTIFDPTRPVLVDLGYSVGGHEVVMEEMAAQILGGGLYEVTFGIPQYGTYILTSADFRQDGVTVPDTWDQTLELARALATGTWTVDETEGPLHGPLPQQWVTGPAALPRPYDPDEAARILDEAGWTRVR